MKKVILLGTSHLVQRKNEQEKSFFSYLERLCKNNNIKAIAEEIDGISIAAKVSVKLKIKYKIIEPTPDEHIELGIEDRTDIDYEFKRKYNVENYSDELTIHNLPSKAYEDYNKRIQNVYRKREAEWLRRVHKLNIWPMLIICGANHCQPFFKLLSKEGIDTVKELSEWSLCRNTQ